MTKKDETPGAGHNSVAADELKAFVARLERLDEEADATRGDIKEVYAEAKGRGFDTKALRHILKVRKRDQAELQEFEAIVELYASALGMGNVFA